MTILDLPTWAYIISAIILLAKFCGIRFTLEILGVGLLISTIIGIVGAIQDRIPDKAPRFSE